MIFQIESVAEVGTDLWRVLASYVCCKGQCDQKSQWVVFHLTKPPQFRTTIEKKRPHMRPLLPGDEIFFGDASFRDYQTEPIKFKQATYTKGIYQAIERMLLCPFTEARWKAEE